jgi:hypothetical protein
VVNDTAKVMTIRYAGKATGSVAAHVSVAATTGDLTFEQGATTAAAAVTTGINPGASGIIDISDYTTIISVANEINDTQGDWEAWLTDYRPDSDIEISAGNCVYLSGQGTDNDCTGTGLVLYGDTSLETAEFIPFGVTLNGPSSTPHANDMQVLHEVLEINAIASFGGASGGINVYECDDRAGTSSAILDNMPLVTATQTEFALAGEPLYASRGKRLVFECVDASGAITAAVFQVASRSFKFGPSYDKLKLYSRQ